MGSVTSEDLVIKGRIIGPVFGKKVRFGSSARVEGDTFHETIAIEHGAYYEGSIKRHTGNFYSAKELIKTNLAKKIAKYLKAEWLNADKVRGKNKDWDFSKIGILRQVKRMKKLADKSKKKYIVADFVLSLIHI